MGPARQPVHIWCSIPLAFQYLLQLSKAKVNLVLSQLTARNDKSTNSLSGRIAFIPGTHSNFVISARMSATQRIHLNPNAPRAPMMGGGGGGYTPEAVRPRSGGSVGGDGQDVVSQIKRWSSKAEDAIETYSQVSRAGLLFWRL